jgi:hypothetical protein
MHTHTSTGFSYLQHELLLNQSEDSQMSETAKRFLSTLLDEHHVELSQDHNDAALHAHQPSLNKKQKMLVSEDMSDETVLQMAAAGELSLFGSLLATIENGNGDGTRDVATAANTDSINATSTSTRTLIKTCSLAVPPASAPASMDCKEMVMAALHFLSSVPPTNTTFTNNNANANLLQLLPLIRPQQMTPDLEKRSYQKVGDWKLGDELLDTQVAALEQVFLYGSNQEGYVWLGRERFCPRLPADAVATGEDLLLLKGNPPVHATGKPKKAAPVQRRAKKATSTTIMPMDAGSAAPTTLVESLSEAGAKMDRNDDNEAEMEAEIETETATNLAEVMDMASDGNASPLGPTF